MKSLLLANGRIITFDKPRIMGIINCTPDSFARRSETFESAVAEAKRMLDEGADILDIGGESTRPGADPVPLDEELNRVIPVIKAVREISDIPISVDTYKAFVAEKALTAGADIINDISALRFDNDMAGLAAEKNVPIILMHMLGTPQTMQKDPAYDDVVSEVASFFEERISAAIDEGISRDNIILDIGIGFGKRVEDNLRLTGKLSCFREFNLPLLYGASRKSFIGHITGRDVDGRLSGSLAAAVMAVANGADIIRVHDVAATRDAVDVAAAIQEA